MADGKGEVFPGPTNPEDRLKEVKRQIVADYADDPEKRAAMRLPTPFAASFR